ncbi:hypothetical protein [Thalassobellus citreus]|uniref:hypothetical protein n=1 Tax=Thalassobellus citreus TaxID=3367752 RepID=UPI003797C445
MTREVFMWNYIKKNIVPNYYNELYINSKKIYSLKNDSEKKNISSLILYTSLFPSFIQSKIHNNEDYILKKIIHRNYDGAGILIKDNYSIEDYLNTFYKQKFRSNIKRYKRHLESSFDIKYETYFGDISKENFNFLIDNLYILLKKRFKQKNKKNHFLENWENNIKDLRTQINNKKASLLVIYDCKKPISISISQHNDAAGIRFSDCTAYDIDYSKFGLGHLSNYKKLEWCLNNNYIFLDLGNGISNIKKEWCNTLYDFEYQLYYKKKSTLAYIIAYYEIFKIKVKNLIKHLFIKNQVEKNKSKSPKLKPSYSLYKLNSNKNIQNGNHVLVNINKQNFEFLRLPVYNYLFSCNEHINNITIYEVKNELNTYLIKGQNNFTKLILNT